MSIATSCKSFLAFVFVLAFLQPCYAKKAPPVPALLQPWVDWVLYDKEEQLVCIPHYNDPDALQCDRPTALEMTLTDKGGSFRQSWLMHRERWVTLPGNAQQWPRDVRVDGETRIIIQKNTTPIIMLQPGMHTVTGRFSWPRFARESAHSIRIRPCVFDRQQ